MCQHRCSVLSSVRRRTMIGFWLPVRQSVDLPMACGVSPWLRAVIAILENGTRFENLSHYFLVCSQGFSGFKSSARALSADRHHLAVPC